MELETLFLHSRFPTNLSCCLLSPTAGWTRDENKQFERALAMFDEDIPEKWLIIASMIPGKSVWDVMTKYKKLEEDLAEIEAGRVQIPWFLGPVSGRNHDGFRKKGSGGGGSRGCDQQRKKGMPWTEEEHRRFLRGLAKYGKGDWRNIARNYVVSKTPTQVASHAQKYFIRQQHHLPSPDSNSKENKNRRRPSIHDITILNLAEPSLMST